jgi:thiosulfate dehydrogenase [quinone] large subunit
VPLGEQLRNATVAARALLPVRFFFGLTFLYAGYDKLASPTFLDPSSPTSLQAQLQSFARLSPVGGLVRFGEPFAVPIGLLIALAEIGIGIGAISGLAFRIAAAGGATLSLLFWLTASWGTHPYYYGADLPYAIGWIALAVAGHGDLLVPRQLTEQGTPLTPAEEADRRRRLRRGEPVPPVTSPTRRAILQTSILAALALVATSLAAPLRGFAGLGEEGERVASESPTPGPTATEAAGASPGPTPVPSNGPSGAPLTGLAVASIADVQARTAVPFTVPMTAPSPLPAGDPGVVVRLSDGSFVAYDTVCTHEGCTVEWAAQYDVLFCPCHGAAFDPANHAEVLQGPARQPLAELPIEIDQASGEVRLKA